MKVYSLGFSACRRESHRGQLPLSSVAAWFLTRKRRNLSSGIRETGRARGVPRTRRLRLIGGDRMRTYLLPLAVLFLIAVAPCRGEYDATGIPSAKPKASGAAFDSAVAANPRATGQSLVVKA